MPLKMVSFSATALYMVTLIAATAPGTELA